MAKEPFIEIEHTADLAIRVYGEDLPALFRHAAQGMFSLMRCKGHKAEEPVESRLHLKAEDPEILLVDWLDELLYLSERQDCCFDQYEIEMLGESELRAVVRATGGARPRRGIKAVTFADLDIRQVKDGYETIVTFDV